MKKSNGKIAFMYGCDYPELNKIQKLKYAHLENEGFKDISLGEPMSEVVKMLYDYIRAAGTTYLQITKDNIYKIFNEKTMKVLEFELLNSDENYQGFALLFYNVDKTPLFAKETDFRCTGYTKRENNVSSSLSDIVFSFNYNNKIKRFKKDYVRVDNYVNLMVEYDDGYGRARLTTKKRKGLSFEEL